MSLAVKNSSHNVFHDNFLNIKGTPQFKSDLYEREGIFYIEIDAPGFNKEDISINFNDGYITINATKESSHKDKSETYISHEIHSNQIKREFYIGNVDPNKIKVLLENNELHIETDNINNNENNK